MSGRVPLWAGLVVCLPFFPLALAIALCDRVWRWDWRFTPGLWSWPR